MQLNTNYYHSKNINACTCIRDVTKFLVENINAVNLLFEKLVLVTRICFLRENWCPPSPLHWSDAVLYRKSGFGTAKGYKLRK